MKQVLLYRGLMDEGTDISGVKRNPGNILQRLRLSVERRFWLRSSKVVTSGSTMGAKRKDSENKRRSIEPERALELFSEAVLHAIQTIRKESEGDSSLKRFATTMLGQLNRLKQISAGEVDDESIVSTSEIIDRIYGLVDHANQTMQRDLNPLKVHQITPGRFTFEVPSDTRVRFNSWEFDSESRSFGDPMFAIASAMDYESTVFETKSFKIMKRSEESSDAYILSKQFGFCGSVMIYVGSETTQVNFDCMHNDHLDGEVISAPKITLQIDKEELKSILNSEPIIHEPKAA